MSGQTHPFGLKLKLDFNINVDLTDIVFTNGNINKYNENSNNVFGEKLCLIYTFDFTIYNVQFSMKILAFAYEKSSEILKLDIDLGNKHIEKEIAACRNFLQRHRNLNATFSTLIQFAKFVETRRLISAIVIAKEPKVVFSKYEDGGLVVKYLDNLSNVLIGICWSINWNLKESMVVDVIEVYYNNFVLPNANDIKYRLTSLTHPTLDFHTKLKLWKLLMNDLRKNTKSTIQAVITITEPKPVSEADSVLVISDNDEDNNNTSSSQISKNKRRKMETEVCSSSVIYVVPD
ncbi:hypothetical protein NQ314_012248 [Rhamnusium bicolor]|uniref:Uncharacterized protein n=1 Tax=Rhamnusium bicolor TaxID=1586634 RepID=A0AAV8XC83_9CUCU|nr:hypothetical protein NQ314_012248 [Rhamnusium bicolor]